MLKNLCSNIISTFPKVIIPEQPVDPLATIVPLLFVIVVTAIKQVSRQLDLEIILLSHIELSK